MANKTKMAQAKHTPTLEEYSNVFSIEPNSFEGYPMKLQTKKIPSEIVIVIEPRYELALQVVSTLSMC